MFCQSNACWNKGIRIEKKAQELVHSLSSFITIDEQLQYNRGCYMPNAGYAFWGLSPLFKIINWMKNNHHVRPMNPIKNEVCLPALLRWHRPLWRSCVLVPWTGTGHQWTKLLFPRLSVTHGNLTVMYALG